MKRTKDNQGHQTVAPDGKPHNEQPKWRRDFPIDWPQNDFITRREFIKFGVLTSLALTVGQGWLVLKKLIRKEEQFQPKAIASVDDLPIGDTLIFEYPDGSTPRILLRLDEENFVAYDQQCTHLLCPVLPEEKTVAINEEGKLHCPCHNGWFDAIDGRPLAGPPRRPLPKVHLEVRDGTIYATHVELRI